MKEEKTFSIIDEIVPKYDDLVKQKELEEEMEKQLIAFDEFLIAN